MKTFDLRPILFTNGILLFILAAAMIVPACADAWVGDDNWKNFALSAAVTLFIAVSIVIVTREERRVLNTRQGFCMVATAWATLSLFGALPFIFSDTSASFIDALFESTSGITTTGATVLTRLDTMSPGILLWRGMLQWLGGVGIIVMAILLLPELRVGGMQFFRPEGPESETMSPRLVGFATRLWGVYTGITILGFILLLGLGLSPLDAAVHTMTSVATGGFSTHDLSVAQFNSLQVEITLMLLMLAGALPFAQILRALAGKPKALTQDPQVRWLLIVLAVSILLIAFQLSFDRGYPLGAALRASAFNTISMMTGTGYATDSYDTWGALPLILLLVLMIVGGCTGSSCSGLKMFRVQLLLVAVKTQLYRISHPQAVYANRYAGQPVNDALMLSVMIFVSTFIIVIAILSVILGLLGLDAVSAVSGAVSMVANIGPAYGPIIGPTGNYASLSPAVKAVLCGAMLLGRIELYALLAMLAPSFWRS